MTALSVRSDLSPTRRLWELKELGLSPELFSSRAVEALLALLCGDEPEGVSAEELRALRAIVAAAKGATAPVPEGRAGCVGGGKRLDVDPRSLPLLPTAVCEDCGRSVRLQKRYDLGYCRIPAHKTPAQNPQRK